MRTKTATLKPAIDTNLRFIAIHLCSYFYGRLTMIRPIHFVFSPISGGPSGSQSVVCHLVLCHDSILLCSFEWIGNSDFIPHKQSILHIFGIKYFRIRKQSCCDHQGVPIAK